jgi:chromosomal replication initiator protein
MDNIKPRGSEIDTIIKEICTYYRVRPEDILSDRRVKNNITPRHMMIYLLCKMTKYNTHHIARKIDRDPTTVLYAYKKIQQNLQSYQKDLDVLEPKLKQMLPPW